MPVSVVIPAYNAAAFVEEPIRSVYGQTVEPAEVIVVNDGSADDTESVLRRLQASLPQSFRWVTTPNRGEAAARNLGVTMATGDFIAFLDHDDIWYPQKLAIQLEQLAGDSNLGVSFTAYNQVEPGTTTAIRHASWDSDPQVILEGLLSECTIRSLSLALIRREILDLVPEFDENLPICCDWLMWLRVAAEGIRIGYIPEVLAEYRWHGGNLSANLAVFFDARCQMLDQFHEESEFATPFKMRLRECRARWHLWGAIQARLTGDMRSARRHIVTAARIWPRAVRPGWIRMLGLGGPPR